MSKAQVIYENAIGTADTPATLTSAYSGNRREIRNTRHFRGIQLNGTFTPAVQNTVVYILIETSANGEDGWKPMAVGDSASNDTQVGIAATGGADSSTSGIPIVIPKNATDTAGQAVDFWWSTEKFAAKAMRISAKDSNGGTLHLSLALF